MAVREAPRDRLERLWRQRSRRTLADVLNAIGLYFTRQPLLGRGRHPAGLNFGDCFAYALAHVRGEPLLAKGHDLPLSELELVPLQQR